MTRNLWPENWLDKSFRFHPTKYFWDHLSWAHAFSDQLHCLNLEWGVLKTGRTKNYKRNAKGFLLNHVKKFWNGVWSVKFNSDLRAENNTRSWDTWNLFGKLRQQQNAQEPILDERYQHAMVERVRNLLKRSSGSGSRIDIGNDREVNSINKRDQAVVA